MKITINWPLIDIHQNNSNNIKYNQDSYGLIKKLSARVLLFLSLGLDVKRIRYRNT